MFRMLNVQCVIQDLLVLVVISALVMIVVGALMVPIVLKVHIKVQAPSAVQKTHGALGHAETNNTLYKQGSNVNSYCL